MSNCTIQITDALHDYMLSTTLREASVLKRLREETASMKNHNMQIGPEQGQFMALLVELTGAVKTLEVGTFTGYSALAVAMALPADGKITACDVSAEWADVGRKYWREAGVEYKIDLNIAPASETLENLIIEGAASTYDFAFIDADKTGYDTYYEQALTLIRPGGLIAIDNVLWDGNVIDPDANDEDTEAIRALNKKMGRDERVSVSMIPIGDGLTLARKR